VRLAIVAGIGAIAGAVLPFLLFTRYEGHAWSVATITVLGAVIAVSVYQAIPGAWRGRL
jgi:hypothetical protein